MRGTLALSGRGGSQTYDHECNVIPMNEDLAKARLAFLIRITTDELAREKARRYLRELKEGERVLIY